FAGHLAQFFLELVDFRAFAANDHPWSSRENGDAAASRRTLDQNTWDRSRLKFLLQQLADLLVFGEQFAEFLFIGIPLGTPVAVDRDAKTDWIGFLTHNLFV